MSVGRICSREVSVVDTGESVEVAAQRMAEQQVGTLVVVSAEKDPIGILTDRDLVIRVVARGLDPGQTRVETVMTPHPRTVSELAPIESALASMKAGGLRRLPVVDGTGKLVGILSLDDALALLAEELTIIGGLLEHQAPPPAQRLLEAKAAAPEAEASPPLGERALDEKFRRALARRLRHRREEIFARVAETEADLEALAEERESELVERGQEETVTRLLALLDERGRREVEALDQTLERLSVQAGTVCRVCGQRIPYGRLRMVPTTTLCVECARAEERRPRGA